ncbi:hypothetical protein OOT00_09525 [Desulfobotulus sp. H1]|uniref:Uncharacterized protein n=1 Tax=Desulfobotulus pelophilus TaxID=2823377 RepID=A0ABT3N9T8_9BACT|nr:hypothetical protein [Desulfobotulus pelophilus]MCW7754226.1 hypothetical protein [Desulfobotulus pelophilus]
MTKEAINANLDVGGLETALQMEDRNQMMIAYTYRMTPHPEKLRGSASAMV